LRNEILAVLLVLLFLGGLGAGYLAGTSNLRTVTFVSTASITTTVTSALTATVSPSGLQLQIVLNSTSIRQGGALRAQIVLLNTLAGNLTLAPDYSSNPDILKWNGYDFLCGINQLWGLAGFALFSGLFSPENISSAGSPLSLAPQAAIPCVIWPRPVTVILLPYSDKTIAYYNESSPPPVPGRAELNATTEACVNQTGGASLCGAVSTALFGYWNSTTPFLETRNATTSSPYFHYFPPGPYTLVAEDLWNQTVYTYFEVG
jgi:hypothetical protein